MESGLVHEGKVAVITGGTGALGTAVLPMLVRRNFRVASTYLIPEEASAIEELLDLDEDRLMLRRVDCTDSEAVSTFMKEAADTFGPINVLCSLVGGWAGGRFISESDDVRFDRMIDLNLRSAFNVLRVGIPLMRDAEWGRIILVGSRATEEGAPGQAAFNAAKAGVMALARTAAMELDDTNITSNVLLPSVIDTEATRAALPYADYVRWPKPEEIARVIDFLASPASAVINGAAIPVYGQT
jgi:NAD(P)-dependent dehydrogenase (short-subunit alcohol dehydrogenase family)